MQEDESRIALPMAPSTPGNRSHAPGAVRLLPRSWQPMIFASEIVTPSLVRTPSSGGAFVSTTGTVEAATEAVGV